MADLALLGVLEQVQQQECPTNIFRMKISDRFLTNFMPRNSQFILTIDSVQCTNSVQYFAQFLSKVLRTVYFPHEGFDHDMTLSCKLRTYIASQTPVIFWM